MKYSETEEGIITFSLITNCHPMFYASCLSTTSTSSVIREASSVRSDFHDRWMPGPVVGVLALILRQSNAVFYVDRNVFIYLFQISNDLSHNRLLFSAELSSTQEYNLNEARKLV